MYYELLSFKDSYMHLWQVSLDLVKSLYAKFIDWDKQELQQMQQSKNRTTFCINVFAYVYLTLFSLLVCFFL